MQQCYKCLSDGAHSRLKIISDNIDVFALAFYFFLVNQQGTFGCMEQTVKGRSIVSIGVTVRKHLTTLKAFCKLTQSLVATMYGGLWVLES